jgi:hypothetical protein
MRRGFATLAVAAAAASQAAVDVDSLWDYADPAVSEQRFRAALGTARGDDALVLRTQIARTLGLRGRYDDAHAELGAIAAQLERSSAEPRVRALLERGRIWRSSGAPARGRPLFVEAYERAHAAGLEALAADALHMVALAESALDGRLEWNRKALAYARAARDPKARIWQGPILNNLASDLRGAGRLEESLATFRESLRAYEAAGRERGVRIARWQVANVLRLMGRADEALAIQLALEADNAAAGQPDRYVFEELEKLHAARGDEAKAALYREKARASN